MLQKWGQKQWYSDIKTGAYNWDCWKYGLFAVTLSSCLNFSPPPPPPHLQEATSAVSDAEVGDGGGRKTDQEGEDWVNSVVGLLYFVIEQQCIVRIANGCTSTHPLHSDSLYQRHPLPLY